MGPREGGWEGGGEARKGGAGGGVRYSIVKIYPGSLSVLVPATAAPSLP